MAFFRGVRRRLRRFNQDGLDDRPECGRKRRITEPKRSRIVALVKLTPPGRLEPSSREEGLAAADEEGPAYWTLDTLTEAARAEGIEVGRSQVRRILLAEGCDGGARGPGSPAGIPSSPQKNTDCRPLHRSAGGHDGSLRRRTGPGDPPRGPLRPGLVA